MSMAARRRDGSTGSFLVPMDSAASVCMAAWEAALGARKVCRPLARKGWYSSSTDRRSSPDTAPGPHRSGASWLYSRENWGHHRSLASNMAVQNSPVCLISWRSLDPALSSLGALLACAVHISSCYGSDDAIARIIARKAETAHSQDERATLRTASTRKHITWPLQAVLSTHNNNNNRAGLESNQTTLAELPACRLPACRAPCLRTGLGIVRAPPPTIIFGSSMAATVRLRKALASPGALRHDPTRRPSTQAPGSAHVRKGSCNVPRIVLCTALFDSEYSARSPAASSPFNHTSHVLVAARFTLRGAQQAQAR